MILATEWRRQHNCSLYVYTVLRLFKELIMCVYYLFYIYYYITSYYLLYYLFLFLRMQSAWKQLETVIIQAVNCPKSICCIQLSHLDSEIYCLNPGLIVIVNSQKV